MTGILAAYALALQILLSGIIATQMAVGGAGGAAQICFGGGQPSDDGNAPVAHVSCAVCAFASACPPLPSVSQVAAVSFRASPAPRLTSEPSIARPWRDIHSARGPPEAV
jgi:hypothetical protein